MQLYCETQQPVTAVPQVTFHPGSVTMVRGGVTLVDQVEENKVIFPPNYAYQATILEKVDTFCLIQEKKQLIIVSNNSQT